MHNNPHYKITPATARKLHALIPADKLMVWVLAPLVETTDPNIEYFYDFTQSIAEYTKTFAQLGIDWKWQPVTMDSYEQVIEGIAAERDAGRLFPVVFNICDGDEVNGTPGISVVNLLEEKGLIYTGADAHFYDITTSKITMKEAFDVAAYFTMQPRPGFAAGANDWPKGDKPKDARY